MELNELTAYLADFLNITAYEDYCPNGVQIEGRSQVKRLVTGVSASERLFTGAVKRNADAVLVHHGLFWKNTPQPLTLTGIIRTRVKILLARDINLLGYHLPLDGHPTLGNNVLIAKALGLQDVRQVAIEGLKTPLMAVGTLKHTVPFEAFNRWANEIIGASNPTLQLGRTQIQNVAVISGAGSGHWRDAAEAGADVLVTGEAREDVVRAAEEVGLNLCACGHYNTEKWGVRALGEHLAAAFGLEAEFVDIPNPI
ncbi:MAG: Nif3-like dinuclear metal center hexameric protein [Calditrichaeota bacterium]|nr:Nif3-like dinuclear metal center hexameric protein [Calditrichota bacterium]